jgi:hypothetical protein
MNPPMKRCPSHQENYEVKARALPRPLDCDVLEEEKDYEDDGIFICKHGIEMSRRDSSICDKCYWESRPTDESRNYYASLKQ